MRKSKFLVTVALVAGSIVGPAASPASADTYYWRHFVGVGSGRCLDVDTNSNTIVQLWSCDSGNDESWRLAYVTNYGGHDYYRIINRRTDTCLTIPIGNTSAGTAAVMAPCGSTASNQWWYVSPTPTSNPFGFVNAYSNLTLDARNGGTGNGTVVQQWYANGTVAQQWRDVAA